MKSSMSTLQGDINILSAHTSCSKVKHELVGM